MRAGSLAAALINLRWLLGSRGLAALLSLVYLAIATRTLGPVGFGQFALVTGMAATILLIVSFQTWQIIVRYGTDHLHAGADARLARLIKAALALDLGGALAGCAIAAIAVRALGPSFGWDSADRTDAWSFAAVILLAFRSTPVGILRLNDKFAAAAAADTALPLMRFVGALAVLAAGPSVRAFLIAWAAAEIVSAAAFWLLAWRSVPRLPWRQAPLRWAALRTENPGILRFAAVTSTTQSLTLATRQLPVLMVGFFASPAAAGAYRFAHQLGRAMATVAQLFSRALFPEMMRLRTSGDHQSFAPILRRIIRFAAVGGGALFAILLLAGKPLLILIAGEAFAPAYPLLLVLGGAAVIELIGVGFEPALIASGRAGTALRVQAIGAGVLMTLMIALIPIFGTTGAAWAVLAGSSVTLLLMGLAVRRALHGASPSEARPPA